jgi:hypothetical protein
MLRVGSERIGKDTDIDVGRRSVRKSQKEVGRATDLKVIDIDAFINWANSDAVVEVLFKGSPRTAVCPRRGGGE